MNDIYEYENRIYEIDKKCRIITDLIIKNELKGISIDKIFNFLDESEEFIYNSINKITSDKKLRIDTMI